MVSPHTSMHPRATVHTYTFPYTPARIHTNRTIQHASHILTWHTFTYIYIYINSHTRKITHARMHACTHARMHACTHARMHACTHARMHACTHARMHSCTHARMHACTHARNLTLWTRAVGANWGGFPLEIPIF